MPRRGRSTTIGKIGKFHQDRRVSEIRALGELLRREQGSRPGAGAASPQNRRESSQTR
ncbi:hypothetical protein GA0074692_4511 [Micromonospora pallida]|uniref:Uncharacterized protein n=1 Tax=Micromonospora pallida TaxID=145854 RepID=A0A1C6T6B1_9ACTN|nr:hypothetical protein GA0074692_4511 [Micromonospora pallida]